MGQVGLRRSAGSQRSGGQNGHHGTEGDGEEALIASYQNFTSFGCNCFVFVVTIL
jgi:hypothetical protein